MGSDVPSDRVDALARERIAAAVAEQCPQAEMVELLAVQDALGLPNQHQVEVLRERRKAGRPPGARNKRTETLTAQVDRLFGNPVLRAAALAMMPVDELAASLGVRPMEALQEQRLWLGLVLPFVAARMPIAVDVNNRQVVNLTIVDMPADGDGSQSSVVEVLEYQAVSEAPNETV
jgi:hypothetical protein